MRQSFVFFSLSPFLLPLPLLNRYELSIEGCINLPCVCEMVYLEYVFDGETFTTESVLPQSNHPSFEYKQIHHTPAVTRDFLKYLHTTFVRVNVFAQPGESHTTRVIKA